MFRELPTIYPYRPIFSLRRSFPISWRCWPMRLGVPPTSLGTRRFGTATVLVLSSLLSGFGPAPEEVVIDASELEDSIVVGSVEREFLDGGVHFEQHLALAVVAHKALAPEEGGAPGDAGHRLVAVTADGGQEAGVIAGQRGTGGLAGRGVGREG